MTDLERLLAIEEIKRLKARYFYHLDHRDWASWKAEVFTPDASLDVPDVWDDPVVGIDNIIALVSKYSEGEISVHHGHMPDIEILSADTAKGIWAMEDTLRRPKDTPSPTKLGYTYLHGYGHYRETYVRGPTGWRIKTVRLTRLYVEQS